MVKRFVSHHTHLNNITDSFLHVHLVPVPEPFRAYAAEHAEVFGEIVVLLGRNRGGWIGLRLLHILSVQQEALRRDLACPPLVDVRDDVGHPIPEA